MKQSIALRIFTLGIIVVPFLFLSACGTSQPAKFYTLTSVTFQQPMEKAVSAKKNVFIAIGPIEIPEYLNRAEIVTRADQNQLIVAEFDLWGGSIKTDISRVLIENIGFLLAGDEIAVVAWKTNMAEYYRIPIILNRFDAIPGSSLILKAQWAMFDKEGKIFLSYREITVTKPIKGSNYSSIVASMSEALGDLSKAIAESIKSVKGS